MIDSNISVANSDDTSKDSNNINSAIGASNVMNKDDFLKLFVEQLKNQDPMNPMENYEVASQLAQYSSLEQLVNVNDNFKKFLDLTSMNAYFQGVNLIGKNIEYSGDKIDFNPEKESDVDIKFKLDESAPKINVNIYDEDDKYIKSLTLENVSAGDNSVKWDGKDSQGKQVAKGLYKYEIIGFNAEGEQIKYEPFGKGRVESIRYDKEKSEALIKVNGDEVDITSITNVGG
jgi:flagellar basal-body rod modification protein FlgD